MSQKTSQIRETVKFVFFALIIYLIGFIFGFINFSIDLANPEDRTVIKGEIKNEVSFFKILTQNLKVIMTTLSGGLLFGSMSIIALFLNGFVNGVVLESCLSTTNPSNALKLLIPHGIFEIPAIIIAGAAGLKIPYEIIRYLAGKKEQILTKEDVKEYLTLALISIILIVIAAWIEANVTLKTAKAMLNSTTWEKS